MSARKSSHRTIFLIVSSGSPLALIASSLRSTSKKPVCPMTRSLHPPMAHCRQRVRFAATWREEFFEVPLNISTSHFPPAFTAERRKVCSRNEHERIQRFYSPRGYDCEPYHVRTCTGI